MPLSLYIGGPIARRGLLKREPSAEHLFAEIRVALADLIIDLTLKKLTQIDEREGKLCVWMHPAAEPVEFFPNRQGYLLCSATTSAAGPGYHAFLVEMLDKIAVRCGFEWEWENAAQEFRDDTGYWRSRDFEQLQVEMLTWLRSAAGQTLELREDATDAARSAVCMPLHFGLKEDYFAVAPCGYLSKEWFEEVASREVSQLHPQGVAFFPWWNRGQDAAFWTKYGIVKMWVDLPWHPPIDDEERHQYQLVLECFRRARDIDPNFPLPAPEIQEIETLLHEDPASDHPPAPNLIGFRRKRMWREMTGGWTVVLPGYYYADWEDDDRTALYWFGGRTVRGSSFVIAGTKTHQPWPPDKLLSRKPDEIAENSETYEFKKDHLAGQAAIHRTQAEDEDYWTLHGRMATTEHVCVVTIRFEEPSDKDWALETWRSVFHSSKEEPA